MMSWTEFLQTIMLPAKFRTGYPGIYSGICYEATSDTTTQAMSEAALAPWLDSTTSPDDALTPIAEERGLIAYWNETPALHRARLLTAWNTWQSVASESGLAAQIALAFSGVIYCSDSTIIDTWLTPGGHPEIGIQNWPSSHEWWSQFKMMLVLTDSIGAGADGRSVLISENQLSTIRGIISKFKPVDWVCREITVVRPGNDYIWGEPSMLYLSPFPKPAIKWGKTQAGFTGTKKWSNGSEPPITEHFSAT